MQNEQVCAIQHENDDWSSLLNVKKSYIKKFLKLCYVLLSKKHNHLLLNITNFESFNKFLSLSMWHNLKKTRFCICKSPRHLTRELLLTSTNYAWPCKLELCMDRIPWVSRDFKYSRMQADIKTYMLGRENHSDRRFPQ